MQAEKSPAFSFYAKEWIADTREFPPDIRGALADLMAFCWVNGSVPDTATGVATLVGIPLERLQEQDGCWWFALRSKFGTLPDRPGRMFYLRLEVEREKQEEKRAQASEAGRLSAEARARKRVHAKFNGRATSAATSVGTDASTEGQRKPNLAVAVASAGGSNEPPDPAQPAAGADGGDGERQDGQTPARVVRAARTRPRRQSAAPPLPFRAGEACAEVQKYAAGRFLAPEPLEGGHAIKLEKVIRVHGNLRQWAEMGKWFAAGYPQDRRGPIDIGTFAKMASGWFPFVAEWCKGGRKPYEPAARPAFRPADDGPRPAAVTPLPTYRRPAEAPVAAGAGEEQLDEATRSFVAGARAAGGQS